MEHQVKPLPADDLAHVLDHTRELWGDVRGRSFFITGGTGFFGLWLLESFAAANDRLGLNMKAVVLTRNPAAFARKAPHLCGRPDLSYIQGDVRDFAFPPGQFDYIVHAATEVSASPASSSVGDMLDVIIGGTRRVLEFARGCGVRSLLLTSSGAVYGPQPADVTHVAEEYRGAPDPLLPGSAYGEGKRISEHMCVVHALQHGYQVKIARCFAFVGPHLPLDAHYAVGNFIRDGLRGDPIRIHGDGTPMRSYLYASDLAVWLWTLLFRGPSARAYNVGSPFGLGIRDLAATVSTILGGRSTVTVMRPVQQAVSVSRYVPDVSRARDELGLECRIPLTEAITRTAAWHIPATTAHRP